VATGVARGDGWLSRARGATVITGKGGDEIFGARRATSLSAFLAAVRGSRRDRRPTLHRLAREAAPARVRVASARRRMAATGYLTWLRPPISDDALDEVARLTAAESWSWAKAVRAHARMPALTLGLANRDWMAASFGARFSHPFLHPAFVDAVARQGGRLGYAGRTDAMRRIFGDLLPDAVLARQTKASFNTVFHGRATRAFAGNWDGSGVDPDVVDVEVLRSLWLADRVHPGTTPL
jgi:asparagine synthetase B (glutamine-hydrolysing)